MFVGFLIQGIRDLITGCSDCFLVGYCDLVLCGFQGRFFHFWRRDIEISCRACGIVAFSCDPDLDDPWFYVVYIFYGIVGWSYRVEVIIQNRHVLDNRFPGVGLDLYDSFYLEIIHTFPDDFYLFGHGSTIVAFSIDRYGDGLSGIDSVCITPGVVTAFFQYLCRVKVFPGVFYLKGRLDLGTGISKVVNADICISDIDGIFFDRQGCACFPAACCRSPDLQM